MSPSVSVITIGEFRTGALSAAGVTTRYRRLRTLIAALGLGPILIDTKRSIVAIGPQIAPG